MVTLRVTTTHRVCRLAKGRRHAYTHFPAVDFVEQSYIITEASLLQRVPAKRLQHVGNAAPTPVVPTGESGGCPLNSVEFVDASLHVRTPSRRSVLQYWSTMVVLTLCRQLLCGLSRARMQGSLDHAEGCRGLCARVVTVRLEAEVR